MDAIRVRSDQPRRADLASLVSFFPSREAGSVGNVGIVRAESLSLSVALTFSLRRHSQNDVGGGVHGCE